MSKVTCVEETIILPVRKGRLSFPQLLPTVHFKVSQSLFLSFAEHLLGYISVGKGFWEAYRISWSERSFFPAQSGWRSCAWLHKLMTSHAVQGMWICTRTVYVHFQGNGSKHHVGSKLLDFILRLFLLVSTCYMVRNIFVFKISLKNVFILNITTWKV